MTYPLQAKDLYHTGIVVPDLEASIARMTALAGYRWTQINSVQMPIRMTTGDRVLQLRYVYSLDAPYVELVQEVPGTPLTAAPHGAIHHLGYFCDDFPMTSKRLEEAGFVREACAVVDGMPSIFAFYLDPAGVRIEIVDRERIPDFPAYLRSNAAS